MKNLLLFILVLISAKTVSVYTQDDINDLRGYKYISIQYKGWASSEDKYKNIVIYTVSTFFESKGYKILTGKENKNDKPEEINKNPCLVLFCLIHYDWLLNTTSVTLKNCKERILYSEKAHTENRSAKRTTKKALRKLDRKLNYYYDPSLTPKSPYLEVEKTNETENSLKEYYSKNQLNEIEGIYKSYETESLPYYKIGIKKRKSQYIAIIIEAENETIWKQGEIKAYFEPSSMKGLYSTEWYMGDKSDYNKTFAYIENESILNIEFKNPETGKKRLDKFIKMYPSEQSVKKSSENNVKSSGSGFVMNKKGVIATNAHVVSNSNRIEIYISNEIGTNKYSGKILLKDETNDVALIKINDTTFSGFNELPYKIVEEIETGEEVFTIGFPLNTLMGENFKVTNGIISSSTGIGDDVRYLQTTTPIQPGNSGGPLFNKNGNVVGITTAKLNEKSVGTSIENVNYAIKAPYLLNLYRMLPSNIPLSKNSTLKQKELKEQIKILKNYVCLIKIY